MWDYCDVRARRLGLLDTKLSQAAAMFVALIIVKLVPRIMDVCVWWFVVLAIVFAVKPLITFFGRGDG